jgi:preprotein translocase subunit SecE
MIKIPQKSSETVKDRQYNDQDTTEVMFFTVSDDFCGILIIVLSVLYGFWWLLWYLDHCIVCPLRFLMTSPQKSSETVKDRQYNDQDTTEGIRNRKGQTIQWSRYHRSHQKPKRTDNTMIKIPQKSSETVKNRHDFCGILIIVLSVLYGFWWLLWYLDHWIVCPLRFLMTSVVSWSLYCLFFTDDQDTTEVIRNRKEQTIQWSRYHRSHQKP